MRSTRTLRVAPVAIGMAAVFALAPVNAAARAESPRSRYEGDSVATGFLTINPSSSAKTNSPSTMTQLVVVASSGSAQPNATNAERSVKLMRRLAQTIQLQDGWMGPGSSAPDPEVLTWVSEHLDWLSSNRHDVYVMAMFDGGVAVQWKDGLREFTAELHAGQDAYCYVDDTETDEFADESLPLDAPKLLAFLRDGQLV